MMLKCYKDGERLTIVIDGCTESMEEIISQLIVDKTTVQGLLPLQREEEKAPSIPDAPISESHPETELLLSGEYEGMTVDEAIQKHGVPAAIKAAFFANTLTNGKKAEVMVKVKKCLQEDLERRLKKDVYHLDPGEPDSMKEFFLTYENLIAKPVQDILVRYEFTSFAEFLNSDKELIRREYESVSRKLYNTIAPKAK